MPIFIISFNRVSCLRQLIERLSRHGYRRIFVIDNTSTYPPLWSDYQEIERAGVTVIRLGEKAGSRALWGRNVLETVGVASEFVCTDSDVVPAASCPGTVVQHLQGLLNRHPEVPKIALALRLDSIPPRFRHRAAVLRCEAQFWRRPAARGRMAAEVDTTFAISGWTTAGQAKCGQRGSRALSCRLITPAAGADGRAGARTRSTC